VFDHDSFVHQKCSNCVLINLLFGLYKSIWIIDPFVTRFSLHLEALTYSFTRFKCYELRSVPHFLILSLFSPWDSQLSISRSLGMCSNLRVVYIRGASFLARRCYFPLSSFVWRIFRLFSYACFSPLHKIVLHSFECSTYFAKKIVQF
jgi:hypothetical protein